MKQKASTPQNKPDSNRQRTRTVGPAGYSRSGPASGRYYSEDQLDAWRTMLIELIHQISAYLQDVKLLEGVKSQKAEGFEEMVDLLARLSRVPDHDGAILLRYRGMVSAGRRSGKADYVIQLGNIELDAAVANSMLKRLGIRMSHLPARLIKALEVFSGHDISTFLLQIPPPDDAAAIERIRFSLVVFSRYVHAARENAPLVIKKNGREATLPLIRDEKGKPDPNLTLLAALNDLSPETARELVGNVEQWLRQGAGQAVRDASVYDAVFLVKSLRDKLIRPPIEVNNIRWHMVGRGQVVVSEEDEPAAGDPSGDMPTVVVEAEQPEAEPERPHSKKAAPERGEEALTRLVMDRFGKSPAYASQILKTVQGSDYKRIGVGQLAQRIPMADNLLKVLSRNPAHRSLEVEVLQNLQGRFELIPDKIWDEVTIDGEEVTVRMADDTAPIRDVDPNLLKIITTSKGRATIRKKMRNIARPDTAFNREDYRALARDFDITVADAREIIGLLKSCFDRSGHFIRRTFERSIPQFARFERKIFEFMWHYLKETLHRSDRVAFLNSLQLLIAEMRQPKKAISILMTDFLAIPTVISYSDRNALMLSNLLIRKYNKELNLDIELTPEEVLQVKEGINTEITGAVARVIESTRERLLKKIATIRGGITESMGGGRADAQPLPLRYLLSLEREVIIFLSLVGGETAQEVLREAVKYYGITGSPVYHLRDSRQNLISLLQHLKVVLRGMGRVGRDDDLARLDEVSWSEQGFLRLAEGPQERDKIRQVMRWVDLSKEIIVQKSWKDDRDTHTFQVLR